MKRIMLDTNIYGIILEKEELKAVRELLNRPDIAIYGSRVIRSELRATPKGRVDGINLRMDLLRLYEEITKNREISMGKREVGVANSYNSVYGKLGGKTSKRKMNNDFLIVSSASLHNLDIVVSEDNATMLNALALRTYSIVNSVLKLKTPRFIGYEKFKNEFKK